MTHARIQIHASMTYISLHSILCLYVGDKCYSTKLCFFSRKYNAGCFNEMMFSSRVEVILYLFCGSLALEAQSFNWY